MYLCFKFAECFTAYDLLETKRPYGKKAAVAQVSRNTISIR